MKSVAWQPRGQPGWRPLTVLALLVVLAHMLVLQAAPAQLGSGPDLDAAGAKTLTTRSIEAAPLPQAEAVAAAPVAVKPAKAGRKPQKPPANQTAAQRNKAQPAIEIIAQTPSPSGAESPDDTSPTPTPTTEVTPEVSPEVTASATDTVIATTSTTANTTATSTTSAAVPAGSKAPQVSSISLPGSARLLYKVFGQAKSLNYSAKAELAWKTNGDSYDLVTKVSALFVGSRSWSSVGKITGSGLAPTRFADKFKTELAAHFEANKGKITFSANTPDAPWVEGAQDRVSVFLQLGGMLAANPAGFPMGSSVSFLTVGARDTDTWTFVMEREETLTLMDASVPSLKLTRKPRKEFDQKVEIWFAPSLGYLPVRIKITQDNGDFVDQQLTEVVK